MSNVVNNGRPPIVMHWMAT